MSTWTTSSLGYPRLGENREWKKALESFWKKNITHEEWKAEMKRLRLESLAKQKQRGIDWIPVNDFTYYDQMLDMSVMFNIVPERFGTFSDEIPDSAYFAMARGSEHAQASEMTKWFNTNYHYIVPEMEHAVPRLTKNIPLEAYLQAKQELGIEGKPVIIGPITYLKLAKGYDEASFAELLDTLLPLYVQVLKELKEEGVQWVQIDEPSLVASFPQKEIAHLEKAYRFFAQEVPGISIMLQTYFEGIDHYQEITSLPVAGIGLDFVHGWKKNIHSLNVHGFPEDKILGAGIIDGRNIWKSDGIKKSVDIQTLQNAVSGDRIWIQPSCSLQHVPVTVKNEAKLDPVLKGALSFADEKLDEIKDLREALADGNTALLQNSSDAVGALADSEWRTKARGAEKENIPSSRKASFSERRGVQQEKWQLPLFPTTTIGSFPQTKEVRVARQNVKKGTISKAEYDEFINQKIKEWVDIQEDIGLDVYVHGEFERNDMVEFFGEKLAGFAFTTNGWVQSYGSRCVKPPVIYGDVEWTEPMTVKESEYAQSLTSKPMKGMLTGPVTILQWSFVRDDMEEREVTNQIAAALSKEVEALEKAGIEMIQVDEPAIREGLPLKHSEHEHYLDWAVRAFRLATSNVKNTTQIHTHMCYSEFQDMIESIRAMDADVISIETSRSHGELIEAFETAVYDKGIGLGVYDIHSPRIPDTDEMLQMIDRALQVLPPSLFWINPDCGLKTRDIPETVDALKNMTEAARLVRKRWAQEVN